MSGPAVAETRRAGAVVDALLRQAVDRHGQAVGAIVVIADRTVIAQPDNGTEGG